MCMPWVLSCRSDTPSTAMCGRKVRRFHMRKQAPGKRLWRQKFVCCASLICFVMVSMTLVSAQTTVGTGSINGTVTDPSGAVVGGADVTITNVATNFVVKATSNSSGAYNSGALSPGDYRVQVGAKGFSRVSETVRVLVGNTASFKTAPTSILQKLDTLRFRSAAASGEALVSRSMASTSAMKL